MKYNIKLKNLFMLFGNKKICLKYKMLFGNKKIHLKYKVIVFGLVDVI